MRIIFDRSAFHGPRFQALLNSPLRDLVKTGQIRIFLTPVFIEETAAQHGSTRAGGDWRAHLEFAVSVCNGGVFLEKTTIWRDELLSNRGPNARYLFPEQPSRRYPRSRAEVLERLGAITKSGSKQLDAAWAESAGGRGEAQQKKSRQKDLYAQVRNDVSDALRKNSHARSSWPSYRRAELLHAGRDLTKLIDPERQSQLADRWARGPARYPHYTAFVEGFTYAMFHAAEKHNEKIDRNAQADYEQLALLSQTDAIVSNDESFFRQAFDTIWRPRGKRIFTAEEFADLSRRLADSSGRIRETEGASH